MSSDLLPNALVENLRANGPLCVHHITPAAAIPDIVASGGLVSAAGRGQTTARWGANADLGAELVCCSFRPNWGVLNKHFADHESVIMSFNAASVATLPGARLSPINTARREARRFIDGSDQDQIETLDACRSGKRESELLVPGFIPFAYVRFLIFCDHEARDAWWPFVSGTLGIDAKSVSPLVTGDLAGIQLPPDLQITHRVRPVRPGSDQRIGPPAQRPAIAPGPTVTLNELLEELEEEEEWDEIEDDLFEQLYDRDRRGDAFSDFADWPMGDDETLDR